MVKDIKKDDVIVVSFWARAAKPQKGKEKGDIYVALQRDIEPYDQVNIRAHCARYRMEKISSFRKS